MTQCRFRASDATENRVIFPSVILSGAKDPSWPGLIPDSVKPDRQQADPRACRASKQWLVDLRVGEDRLVAGVIVQRDKRDIMREVRPPKPSG